MDSDRIVLGKPGCHGCAGSDYIDVNSMLTLIDSLDGKLSGMMGGVLWWDLCRLFGNTGGFCVGGQCQPSWGGDSIQKNLQSIALAMSDLKPSSKVVQA